MIECIEMTLSLLEHLDSYMFVSHDQDYLEVLFFWTYKHIDSKNGTSLVLSMLSVPVL